jgi:hypothetical protein
MFYRRWRLNDDERARVWKHYGWYTGLMTLGSIFGTLTWAFWMKREVIYFESLRLSRNTDNSRIRALNKEKDTWTALFSVTHAFEFCFLSMAQLLVLDRLIAFACAHTVGKSSWWMLGNKISIAFATGLGVVGICGNIVSAVLIFEDYERAVSIGSVQRYCETTVIIVIVLEFAAASLLCVRRIKSALKDISDSSSSSVKLGKKLHLQIIVTSTFVFATFFIRCIYQTTFAVAAQLQNSNSKQCSALEYAGGAVSRYCNSSCYNEYTIIWECLENTPELMILVVLLSSPVALCVTLWGMTSERLRQMMSRNLHKTRSDLQHLNCELR